MNISDNDIRAAVDWMRASDPSTIITPGKIYHALGKSADCGGCMPLFLDTMRGCESFGVADAPRVQYQQMARPPMLRTINARR